MRLTLRTLLAYLDDTLDPTQAKVIGQKVAESDQARELMEHIKQVTRRRRITTPPTNGPGSKIDPNTIAEYLDSAVSAEQASEVEQICLASDVHLAEVAAAHQILALVLGEPALVPPTAKTRMYGLVKGPESIPFRKPTNPSVADREEAPDSDDVDETLRMGLPSLGGQGKWKQNLLLIGGGFAAAVILGLAIFHLLDLPGDGERKDPNKDKSNQVAHIDEKKNDDGKKVEPKVDGKDTKVDPKPSKDDKKPPKNVEPPLDYTPPPPPVYPDDPKPVKDKTPPFKQDASALPEFRNNPIDNRPFSLGKYVMPSATDRSVVVCSPVGKSDWTRLWGNNLDLQSGRTYIAMPGCKGELQLNRGVQLILWGSIPEILPSPLLFESVVELHNNDQYDLDMTLVRGRAIVGSRSEKPVAVRVRFENPAAANEFEIVDMLLQGKGTQIIIDHAGGFIPPPPPFVKNPSSPERVPPAAFQGYCVLKGSVAFRQGDVTYGLSGKSVLVWNSLNGLKPPHVDEKLPDAFSLNTKPPALPMEIDKKIRDELLKQRNEVLKARDDLSTLVFDNNNKLDVTLAELRYSAEPGRRIMAIRCYAAMGSLADLVDALSDERYGDRRQTAIRSLQNWIAVGRDNEYRLFDQLNAHFKATMNAEKAEKVSEKVMELLHGFTPPDVLVDNLNNSVLTIREMSFLNLMPLAPPGHPLPPFDPTMPAEQRMAVQQAWREMLRRAPTPPPPPPKN